MEKPSRKATSSSIPKWSDEDKPREKLLAHGVENMSDVELLAILLRVGTREKTAVDLAREILIQYDHDLSDFGDADLYEFMQTKGIGEAKAITIKAALELGRRSHKSPRSVKRKINSSESAYHELSDVIGTQSHEECWVLFLNRANKVIGKERISAGGISATVVDVRLILKRALEKLACGIILCHNHPSGNLKPSQSDMQLTERVKEASKWMDIKLFDHLIVTKSGYYSFADEGHL